MALKMNYELESLLPGTLNDVGIKKKKENFEDPFHQKIVPDKDLIFNELEIFETKQPIKVRIDMIDQHFPIRLWFKCKSRKRD